ncbi:hypothetical protein ACFWWC_12675 [Streptomyces sp. NPDC058642]|uniref:hypothetical protein n=1 Tax=Streptomyces sp. NPDC058642 TaxID=3346572 RepID=UPI00365ED1E2
MPKKDQPYAHAHARRTLPHHARRTPPLQAHPGQPATLPPFFQRSAYAPNARATV